MNSTSHFKKLRTGRRQKTNQRSPAKLRAGQPTPLSVTLADLIRRGCATLMERVQMGSALYTYVLSEDSKDWQCDRETFIDLIIAYNLEEFSADSYLREIVYYWLFAKRDQLFRAQDDLAHAGVFVKHRNVNSLLTHPAIDVLSEAPVYRNLLKFAQRWGDTPTAFEMHAEEIRHPACFR
jgi:hypothetical protein